MPDLFWNYPKTSSGSFFVSQIRPVLPADDLIRVGFLGSGIDEYQFAGHTRKRKKQTSFRLYE
jgi:hypothetical protein